MLECDCVRGLQHGACRTLLILPSSLPHPPLPHPSLHSPLVCRQALLDYFASALGAIQLFVFNSEAGRHRGTIKGDSGDSTESLIWAWPGSDLRRQSAYSLFVGTSPDRFLTGSPGTSKRLGCRFCHIRTTPGSVRHFSRPTAAAPPVGLPSISLAVSAARPGRWLGRPAGGRRAGGQNGCAGGCSRSAGSSCRTSFKD